MVTAGLEHLDLNDTGFLIDPYPTYRSLRQHAPFHWYNDRDMWLVSRHADVDAILRDRRFGRVFVPREPQERFRAWNLVNEHTMLEQEPPVHTRLRKLVSKEFTPRRVERLRWRVEKIATELIAPLGDGGERDLIAEVAEPLPVAVIAELLGFPLEDRHLLRPWSNDIVRLYELEADEETEERAIRAAEEFEGYLRTLIRERQATPGDDLLSALASMTLDGDRLIEASFERVEVDRDGHPRPSPRRRPATAAALTLLGDGGKGWAAVWLAAGV
jgi:cytochrome P450